MSLKPRVVSCPTCSKDVVWARDNVWRPFCSERCKMIDLGAWANEAYRIPVADSDDFPEADDSGATR